MNKPEKRKLAKDAPYAYLQYDKGYNHCWYEYEKYLPDKKELTKLVNEGRLNGLSDEGIAKEILKRIGK
ncbi:hypothetical protein LCGC14_2785450 [marine sediment metagenome]|uniref:Uncharacterized protein n=1 Tax=marine sediment metagenome TaxID=412755 RepID=A0A0F9BIH9_9ZZZZ